MDDQRDYAEEAANQREMEREGLEEAVAGVEQRVIAAVRQVIAAGRDRGDSSGAILAQVESLLVGIEEYTGPLSIEDDAPRGTDDAETYVPPPAGVEGHPVSGRRIAWDRRPTVVLRSGQAYADWYAAYARDLDRDVPLWWCEDLDSMARELADLAYERRTARAGEAAR
jgi:hypothetical protein